MYNGPFYKLEVKSDFICECKEMSSFENASLQIQQWSKNNFKNLFRKNISKRKRSGNIGSFIFYSKTCQNS